MVTVPPPTDPEVLPPARNEGALGLGYYIPSDLRKFFERPKERDRGPINAPGFENINSLLRGINFPYNIVAGAGGKTREALDPDLPREERIRAGGEAAIETGIQALLPVAGRMAGQPLSRAIVESFFPVSTPKSAAEAAVDTVEDMGRRNMLKGAAATTGIAALAPEVFIEASKKVPAAVTKTAAKAVPIGAVNTLAAKLSSLRKQNSNLRDAINDTGPDGGGVGGRLTKEESTIFQNQDEMYESLEDFFSKGLSPEDLKNATNESLEEIASFRYDVVDGYIDEIVDSTPETMEMQVGKMEDVIREAKARGLDKAKDKNGISMYPNMASLIDEFESFAKPESADIIQNLPPTAFKMIDEDAAKSTQQLIDEQSIRVMEEELRNGVIVMRDRGDPEKIIEDFVKKKRGDIFEARGLPRDMDDFYADGGVVSNNEDPSRASNSQKNLANKLIDAAISAEGVRAEAKQKFIEGNYAEGIAEYLIGLGGSIPVYKQINAGIGQALREADNQGDYSFGNVLKNLLNPNNSISFVTEKLGLKEGGVVSFAPYLR